LKQPIFEGLVITETVKRAVINELTSLGIHPIVNVDFIN